MYIYNITFMVEPEYKIRFLDWMRGAALPALLSAGSAARNPRLTLVAEVPGDPEFASQACSFALQLEFTDLSAAKEWADIHLSPVIGQYISEFGPEHALSFSTILESIDL